MKCSRQAGAEYRGVVLPRGMTPACLDELAALLNMHGDEENHETNSAAAVRAFEVVERHPDRLDTVGFEVSTKTTKDGKATLAITLIPRWLAEARQRKLSTLAAEPAPPDYPG